MCSVTYLMKVWKIVQRAVFDRAVVLSVKLWEVGREAGRELLDGAEMLQRVVLMEAACVVLSGRCLRRALPRALEVQGFNECFMLNLEPALFAVQRLYVLFRLMFQHR